MGTISASVEGYKMWQHGIMLRRVFLFLEGYLASTTRNMEAEYRAGAVITQVEHCDTSDSFTDKGRHERDTMTSCIWAPVYSDDIFDCVLVSVLFHEISSRIALMTLYCPRKNAQACGIREAVCDRVRTQARRGDVGRVELQLAEAISDCLVLVQVVAMQ
ncbi:hypothetical protein POM88_034449 [Heracleum sosnowskyi]|uniref:Uncharacterized protein n=1 Tax=Heracleum sosnowskyi TaxID=360622 RepID=A0AAD8MD02_9APIA|nr:hypothetical protein POM88_034449 [Heracleum sosnowskyi]